MSPRHEKKLIHPNIYYVATDTPSRNIFFCISLAESSSKYNSNNINVNHPDILIEEV